MTEYLVGAAEKGWEVYCCMLLLRSFVRPARQAGRHLSVLAGCVLAVLCLAADIWLHNPYGRAVVVCLLVTLFINIMFHVRFVMTLVLALLYHGLTIVAEYLVAALSAGILHFFPAGGPVADLTFLPGGVAFTLVSKVLLWGGIVLLGRMADDRSFAVLTDREWWLLFFSSCSTVVAFLIITTSPLQRDQGDAASDLYLAAGILLIDFVVYRMVIEVTEREQRRREDAVFRERVKSEMAMYRSVSENLDRQKKRTHEYKNQLSAISALAAEGKYEELQEYLQKVGNTVLPGREVIDAGHVIVNAILNTKYREATEAGMVFALQVNNLAGLHMEEEDIVVLLSNLLGNAFEACGEGDVIRLKFVLEEGQVILSVQNSMKNGPVVENGHLLSTKTADKEEHGFGIRNVIETVEKYHGKYVIDHDRDHFRFSILIPHPG